MFLLGLIGPAGSGKSAIAEYLMHDHCFEVVAFADALKEGLAEMLCVPRELLEDRAQKEQPIDWLGRSPRELMQTLGTEWGRKMVHPDLWVRALDRRLQEWGCFNPDIDDRIVVSDVRFENEAAWVISRGGLLWEIYGRAASDVRAHESEAGIPPTYARRSIWNGGGWQDTMRQIDQALETDMGLATP